MKSHPLEECENLKKVKAGKNDLVINDSEMADGSAGEKVLDFTLKDKSL